MRMNHAFGIGTYMTTMDRVLRRLEARAFYRHMSIRNGANQTGSDNIGVTAQSGSAPAAASEDDDDGGGDDDPEPSRSTSQSRLPHSVRHFDQLPALARLRTREVLILAGISRATLYRRIEAESFPRPQKTPTGSCFWTAATVRAALEAEVAE